MSMQSIRTMFRVLMAYGVALAAVALVFGAMWPEVVRWGGALGGATLSLLGAVALRNLGPEDEVPLDWLDETEWPSPDSKQTSSAVWTVFGWVTLLLAGVGSTIALMTAVLYFMGRSLVAHPSGERWPAMALSLIVAVMFGMLLPITLLRPRHRSMR